MPVLLGCPPAETNPFGHSGRREVHHCHLQHGTELILVILDLSLSPWKGKVLKENDCLAFLRLSSLSTLFSDAVSASRA